MGVKSTVDLTRERAEEKYIKLKRMLYAPSSFMYSDLELENILEELNDEVNGGEGFENYRIVD